MITNIFKKLVNIFKGGSSDNFSRELYVGNINYHVKPYELRKLFEKYGDIESLKIIRDPRTKRSKGYGFVKFYNSNDAQKARKSSNAQVFKGRELCVDYSKNDD